LLWSSPDQKVQTNGGVFTATIEGTSPPLTPSVLSGKTDVWLETIVGGTALVPRVKLASSPFAFRAGQLSLPFVADVNIPQTPIWIGNAGVGGGIYCTTSGGSPFTLKAYATGSGNAGHFQIANVNNTGSPVYAETNGLGDAVYATTSGSGVAVRGYTTGSFPAAYFQINNAGNTTAAVDARTNGTGYAGKFAIANVSNSSTAVYASTNGSGAVFEGYTTGDGNAGKFSISHATSASAAVSASTNGSGAALEGITTGTGRAGYFEVNNSKSTAPAVFATTNGTDYSLTAINSGSGNYASLAGSNYAVYARSVAGSAIGAYVTATADYARSIYGVATGTGSYGVYGYTSGSGAYALYGFASATNGIGLYALGGSSGYSAILRGNVQIQDRATGAVAVELGTGLDYAEGFDVSAADQVKPGAVLVIDARNPGKLALSANAYDRKVAGIAAGANGLGSGVKLGTGKFDHNVALAGRVYCNVDATQVEVQPGDLLTTSDTPGCAMKVTDYTRAQGAVLGKAMESLERGKRGQILVLVTLQ
jgi:hypothetical protein